MKYCLWVHIDENQLEMISTACVIFVLLSDENTIMYIIIFPEIIDSARWGVKWCLFWRVVFS